MKTETEMQEVITCISPDGSVRRDVDMEVIMTEGGVEAFKALPEEMMLPVYEALQALVLFQQSGLVKKGPATEATIAAAVKQVKEHTLMNDISTQYPRSRTVSNNAALQAIWPRVTDEERRKMTTVLWGLLNAERGGDEEAFERAVKSYKEAAARLVAAHHEEKS